MDQIFTEITGIINVDIRNLAIMLVSAVLMLGLIVLGYAVIMNVFDPPPSANEGVTMLDNLRLNASIHRGTAKGDLYQRKYKSSLRAWELRHGESDYL